MKLAFYYHIPITQRGDGLFLPGYLGVFVDSLANSVEKLFLVMHESNEVEARESNYCIQSKNIHWVNLGKKTPAWHRALFYTKILKLKMKEIDGCDAFIVRSPTPLSPYFHKFYKNPNLYFMVVGDYAEGLEDLNNKTLRDKLIKKFLIYNDYLFRKTMKRVHVMPNSPRLFEKYKNIARSIHQIRTTTLSVNDFYEREDTCLNERIELLYTGRIDAAKGLFELTEALAQLRKNNKNVYLNFVGWETEIEKPVEKALIKKAESLGVSNYMVFHGMKKIGAELNAMYQMADIYIIPSYQEGFPRTIWEAMANSLPVIASKVGAIPDYLTNEVDSILIEPKRIDEIVNSVTKVIDNKHLRKTIIKNALLIARENTLEVQTKRVITIIKENLN